MSWLFSRALVGGYLQAPCSDSAQFAQLNTTKEPDGFLCQGKTMEACALSRYGMTFAPLMEPPGGALLTWYRVAFPVKPIALRLRAKTMQMISGRKCGGSWQMSLPGTYLPKTSPSGRLTPPPMTLSRWVTKRAAYPLPRQTWVQTTYGKGIGFLHTPTTQGNYCAPSMMKHPSCRHYKQVFGSNSPQAQTWLMGWPEDWTELKPLETGKFQQWRQRHSLSFCP